MSISLKDIKVKTRLWLSFSLLASFIVVMGMMTVITFNQVATTTTKLYKHPLTVGRAIREVRTDLHRGRILILKSVLLPDSTTLDSTIAELEVLQKDIDKNITTVKERFLGDMGDVEKLSQEFIKLRKLREGIFDLIKAGNKEQAIQEVVDGINAQQIREMEELIDRIVDFGNEKAALFIEDVTAKVTNTQWWVGGIILISIILTIWIILNTTRTISRSLERALTIAHAIGSDDFSNQMDEMITQSEIGQLLSVLNSMQNQLKERSEADKRIAQEINLVTSTASQGDFSKRVDLIDKAGVFKTIGESINRVLELNQLAIQDLTRVFSAVSQGDLTQTIVNEYSGELALLKQSANATVQKLTEVTEEIDCVTGSASQGDFGKRVDLKTKTGTFKVIGASINRVLEFNQLAIRDLTRVFSAVAQGDLTQTITNEYSGELAQLKKSANTTVQRLTTVTEEISVVTHAASEGDFSKRISLENKTGTFRLIGESINQVLNFNQLAIKDLMHVFSAVAQGDLTKIIMNEYAGELAQLKRDANATVQKLTEIIKIIRTSAEAVSSTTEEISQGNSSLSQRTTQQAASLQETASSMEQMTTTVQQNADNARQANQLAMGARERAEYGNEVVNSTILAIKEISQSSKKINEIITVIDEIAFQTNLLALNAAVEAARAGEYGRGFAVVASEVRSLAQRSASAAKEIKTLIQDSTMKVDEGNRLANQSGQTLADIVTSVKKVSDIVAEISAASTEQSSGIEQVNKSISQMDEVVEQNSALVEQLAAASESMKDQAQELKRQVTFFKVGNNSETASSSSAKRKTRSNGSTTKTLAQNVEESGDWRDF